MEDTMRYPLILSISAGLAACQTPLDAPLSPTFGMAVASMQSQIVPVPESDLPPEGSAARSAAAIARYEKGEVKKLEAQRTSDVNVTLMPYAGGK
jgi:hypothetical protein